MNYKFKTSLLNQPQHFAAREEAGADHAGAFLKTGELDLRVLTDKIQGVFFDGASDGQADIVARCGKRTAEHNKLGVENIDQSGDAFSKVQGDLFEDVDT